MLYRLLILSLFIFTPIVQANNIEVILLGTGTPRPDIERLGPSTAVKIDGRYFIFDAGRGTTIRLQQAGIKLDEIEHVFLTHLHSDHINGLADLWATSWIWQRQHRLSLTGPTGTERLANSLLNGFQRDIRFRSEQTQLDPDLTPFTVQEIEQDQLVYTHAGVEITAFTVEHGQAKPSFGYRIEVGRYVVVISGDTTYSENLINHAGNADLLVHEIAATTEALLSANQRLKKVMSYHTTPKNALKLLNKIKPKLSVFTHLLLLGVTEQETLALIKRGYAGKVFMGKDLMRIVLTEKGPFIAAEATVIKKPLEERKKERVKH